MHQFFITVLRLGVGAALLVGLFGQIVVIPGMAADEVDLHPEYEPYATPYVIVAVIGVACVQAALVAVWMLLAMVRRDAIFTPRAFRWVDTIIGSSTAATLLMIGVTVHLAVGDIPYDDSAMQTEAALSAAIACTGMGVSFVMLIVVLRSLLRTATDLKTEMAAVV